MKGCDCVVNGVGGELQFKLPFASEIDLGNVIPLGLVKGRLSSVSILRVSEIITRLAMGLILGES
jgi:hypothetical protein